VEERFLPLLERDVHGDPLEQFARWYRDAEAVVDQPEAIAVASATPEGRPSVRMVLLKRWDSRGFVFYTSYESRKASELDANPVAALLAHWGPLGRQVRIEGPVARTSPEDSDSYFASRPLGARLGATVSQQSQPISSREELEQRVERLRKGVGDHDVPRPGSWGGFRLRPQVYEFWQHREDRLHDRLRYRRDGAAWAIERLQP
jgi:pyridoxamine 5'-phosphate oxidase